VTDALNELGVERVGAEGERFDTALHEAVIYRASPDATEPTVSVVLRSGYRFGPRLVRAAQVEVVGPDGLEAGEGD
jgi:molecular chaperone GrpE